MQINLIHLQHRTDREERFKKEFAEQGITDYKIWEGITTEPTSAQNINLAHKQIVRWAKENNLESVLIAEDDICFTAKGAWQYFLSQFPKSYDLFFSMIYSAEVKDNRILNGFSGLTMYAVHSKFYDFFLSIPDHVHIDRWLGQSAFAKEYYIVPEYCTYQSGGYTDNLKRVMYYDAYLLDVKMFGREINSGLKLG